MRPQHNHGTQMQAHRHRHTHAPGHTHTSYTGKPTKTRMKHNVNKQVEDELESESGTRIMTIILLLLLAAAAFSLMEVTPFFFLLKDSLLEGGGEVWQEDWKERSLVGMVGVLVTVEIWTLELFGQQLTETPGDRVFAAAQSQAIHLCLCIWLQS